MPTNLKKPIVRRVGRLVVRLGPDGLAIRAFRCRTWYRVSYAEVAWLAKTRAADDAVLFSELEGLDFLKRIGARDAD